MGWKYLPWISACVVVLAAGSGCAVPEPEPLPGTSSGQPLPERPAWLHAPWNLMYAPQVQAGATLAGAVQDLATYLNAPASGDIYVDDRSHNPNHWYFVRQCVVDEHTLEIQATDQNDKGKPVTVTLHFADLPAHRIYVVQARANNVNYAICMHDLIEFYFHKPTHVRALADALYLIQQHQMKTTDEEQKKKLALFEPLAAQYRALPTKPAMSEDQRRLVVQANVANGQKDYAQAIELYEKAIALDPVAYPAAYFNLALLWAQEKAPLSAIHYMKHYLLLVPDAPDARSAQDKIYEWELSSKK